MDVPVAEEAVPNENNEINVAGEQKKNWPRNVLLVTIALILVYIHYSYAAELFYNDRNFSYLSELEREMSLRSEMGFYYSYFKTVVEEKPFVAGITKLMYDKLVEFPNDVNALNRFNIHPEVLLGAIYRYFEPRLNTSSNVECMVVDRGDSLPPVDTCNGIGVPMLFYLEAIWWLAGVTVAAVFLHATLISESILGGFLAVTQYFANHAELTRVQWAPNERENFAWPLLLTQAWLVSVQIRNHGKTTFQLQVAIFFLNCTSLLFWQFSQFVFLTQIAIFFVMEQLRIIDMKSFCIFLHSHFCGLHMAVLLLQGNDMLKSSLYVSFFISVSVYCLFFSSLRIKVENNVDLLVEAWLVFLRIAIIICTSIYIKKLISDFLDVHEDSHIWDLLYSKFSDFNNFHTKMYTCSEVYDFLPWSTIVTLLKSFLIPFAIFNTLNVVNYWYQTALDTIENEKEEQEVPVQDDDDSGIENNTNTTDNKSKKRRKGKDNDNEDFLVTFVKSLDIEPHVFYVIAQMFVYAAMAALIMRLKLLFVTQMCIVSGLLMNRKYLSFILPDKKYMKYIPIVWGIFLVPVCMALFENVAKESSRDGQFSDPLLEELLLWIKAHTQPEAAFAGSLPLLAAVLLSARRPVVAHPHYEHYDARDRTYAVYKMYGRFTPEELYEELTKLKTTYLVVEWQYCYGRSNNNCTFEEIWNAEAPNLQTRDTPLCRSLLEQAQQHFYPVFRNPRYTVHRLHDISLRYMPRSFDT